MNENYKVWFFAGAETTDNRFNIFTASYIRFMTRIFETDFKFIRGVYYRHSILNVMWALNNAQNQISNPEKHKITRTAFNQIVNDGLSSDTQLILTSSSSGSVVAAQVACYLAEQNRKNSRFNKPLHLVLGASMLATGSPLFRQLLKYQKEGHIGIIIHDELQDAGDNSAGIGGTSRLEAYRNAFGIMFPILSYRFKGPSFLNAHPARGHIHRKRSMTVQKAIDFISIILIKNRLAGEWYKQKAEKVLNETAGKEQNIGYTELYRD
jgi:hypothetical protein